MSRSDSRHDETESSSGRETTETRAVDDGHDDANPCHVSASAEEQPDGVDDGREPTARNRFLERRRFLQAAGAVAGASVLAGCGAGDGGDGGSDGGASPTAEDTPAPTPEDTETPEETEAPEEQEPSLEERYPNLRILSPEPENAEAAARATYTSLITPNDEHYIRNHYPTPDIDAADWTVSITGAVDSEVELTLEDLKNEFSKETVFHTMQCSGNGRSYFDPQVGGNQWSFGAVGNAEFGGAPLREVLERYGADTSDGMWLTVMGGEAPDGEDIFTRSIPMSKVMDDCILAYEMNGETLPADHGYPFRMLVPGWFGNNNVKWVDRLHVMDMMVVGDEWESGDQRLYTHWQQYSYRIIPKQDDGAEHYESIDVFDTQEQMENTDQIRNAYMYDQLVKSLIGYPGLGSTVTPRPDGKIEVVGVAWAGDDAVDLVEVSTDGGSTWGEAEILNPALGANSWRLFRYVWDATPGEYTLVSRATDDQGRTQPATISDPDENLRGIQDDKYPWNQKGYGNNAYMPHAVDVTVQ